MTGDRALGSLTSRRQFRHRASWRRSARGHGWSSPTSSSYSLGARASGPWKTKWPPLLRGGDLWPLEGWREIRL